MGEGLQMGSNEEGVWVPGSPAVKKDRVTMELSLSLDNIISDEDFKKYTNVIQAALDIHVDREKIRRGLWKQYSARDQAQTIKFKTERVLNTLSLDSNSPEELTNAVEELLDIINYSVFAVRLLQGRDGI